MQFAGSSAESSLPAFLDLADCYDLLVVDVGEAGCCLLVKGVTVPSGSSWVSSKLGSPISSDIPL